LKVLVTGATGYLVAVAAAALAAREHDVVGLAVREHAARADRVTEVSRHWLNAKPFGLSSCGWVRDWG
jgi:nucleoside-diphosphate-sugar epimerase